MKHLFRTQTYMSDAEIGDKRPQGACEWQGTDKETMILGRWAREGSTMGTEKWSERREALFGDGKRAEM